MTDSTPIIITPGDPAGVGPEIALKALARHDDLRAMTVLMGDENHLTELAASCDLDISFKSWQEGAPLSADAIHLHPLKWPANVISGSPDVANASIVIEAIQKAVELVQNEKASAIVTCPIAKSVLYEAGFTYPGHTEFLGALSLSDTPPIMMLANAHLRVVPATIHLPLSKVAESLSVNALTDLFSHVAHALQHDFGIENPHIAICGFNPHAGEDGAMGLEEDTIIRPAIKAYQEKRDSRATLSGPWAADSLFHAEKRASYDCVIGMYHDQVLIPVKTIDFHGSANITLGLDFVRSSPDHGTAFDIAGQNKANPASLINAIYIARDMAKNRQIER